MDEHKLSDMRWLKVADLCVYCMHVCSKLLIFMCMVVLHTEIRVLVLCLCPMIDQQNPYLKKFTTETHDRLHWLKGKQKQYFCQKNLGR